MKFRIGGIAAIMMLCVSGCMENVVQRRANLLTRTVPEMYYWEVLDNLAVLSVNPSALPILAFRSRVQARTRGMSKHHTRLDGIFCLPRSR